MTSLTDASIKISVYIFYSYLINTLEILIEICEMNISIFIYMYTKF